jgi:hypothetical protein
MVLSPAAQAVLDAAEPFIAPSECLGLEAALAAALRAAAERVVPVELRENETYANMVVPCRMGVRRKLLAIAIELENHQ